MKTEIPFAPCHTAVFTCALSPELPWAGVNPSGRTGEEGCRATPGTGGSHYLKAQAPSPARPHLPASRALYSCPPFTHVLFPFHPRAPGLAQVIHDLEPLILDFISLHLLGEIGTRPTGDSCRSWVCLRGPYAGAERGRSSPQAGGLHAHRPRNPCRSSPSSPLAFLSLWGPNAAEATESRCPALVFTAQPTGVKALRPSGKEK